MKADSRTTGREQAWRSQLAGWSGGYLLFETLTGLGIWLLPFSISTQIIVLLHTAVGLVFLPPVAYYLLRHWMEYRRNLMTHIKLLGYLGMIVLILSLASGLVLTFQAIFETRIGYLWDQVHFVTTFGVVVFLVGHVLLPYLSLRTNEKLLRLKRAARTYAGNVGLSCGFFLGTVGLAWFAYEPVELQAEFPQEYRFKYGEDRPFAPSLAQTETGGAYDPRTLAGSESCGTAGCHEQIYGEWVSSAHRYAAMDTAFQSIQLTMAEQNGPESTRYCGGCHDPISLFSGTKNIFTDSSRLTGLRGYQEGISCLACHAVRETDLKGNAHYVVAQPSRYLFELEYDSSGSEVDRFMRDFLIRAYPEEHRESLNKNLFKAPEYCAACHKQFIDEEINNVGWVQLQNQFDNWRMSRWNHPDDPERTLECRECHMPLVESQDPAAGDSSDYNRSASDGKHRSHRFIGANQMMPRILELPGWEEQVELTEKWLKGDFPIPEIAHKWAEGSAVSIELRMPEQVSPGEEVRIETIITSNKVGHDFPTGPLDIIQSWVELVVVDSEGREVFGTGRVDSQGFIEPGSFILKAEPVDQYGNLIDRHNLWEMVGVRHRRALFPGFADITQFRFFCPDLYPSDSPPSPNLGEQEFSIRVPGETATLHVTGRLNYRKIDQSLLNFVSGAESRLTSPVTVMSTDEGVIRIVEEAPGSRSK